MSEIDRIAAGIAAKAEVVGLPTLAREAEVPYTTVAELARRGWKACSVATFEKLALAANEDSEGSRAA